MHWGAPPDACQRLAAKAGGAVGRVVGALGRARGPRALSAGQELAVPARPRPSLEPAAFLSFQCYFEGGTPAHKTIAFALDGRRFSAEEIRTAPAPGGSALYIDRYDAVARMLIHGFHYGALLSEAGIEPGAADGLQAAFVGSDYLLTRLYGLESLDLYLDPGWIAARPDLLEVYPYQRHLKNYVQVFRRQYRRERGRL